MACGYFVERLRFVQKDIVHINFYRSPHQSHDVTIEASHVVIRSGDLVFHLNWDLPIIPAKSRTTSEGDGELTLHLALDIEPVHLRLDTDYMDIAPPSLATLRDLKCLHCRECGGRLTGTEIERVAAMPSTHWLELADFWTCEHSTVRQLDLKEIEPKLGTCYVGSTFLLLAGEQLAPGCIRSRAQERDAERRQQQAAAVEREGRVRLAPSGLAQIPGSITTPHPHVTRQCGHSHSPKPDSGEGEGETLPEEMSRESPGWCAIACVHCNADLGVALFPAEPIEPRSVEILEEGCDPKQARLSTYSIASSANSFTIRA